MIRAAAIVLALAATGCNDVCEGAACANASDPCPEAPEANFHLEHRWSIFTDEEANPEIVRFIPGRPGHAIVTSTKADRMSELVADEDRLELLHSVKLNDENSKSGLTSVALSPSGDLAAITVTNYRRDDGEDGGCASAADCEGSPCIGGKCSCYDGAPPGCACGAVIFAEIRPDRTFGAELGRIGVGYAPDNGAFSPDGRYFITADEDDQDELGCKPPARLGGSVSIIELGAPTDCQTDRIELADLGGACRVNQIPVDDLELDEPEEVVISPLGIAVIAIQDTDKLGFVRVEDFADADALDIVDLTQVVPLSGELRPDGMDLTPDGRRIVVSLEDADAYMVVDVETHEVLQVQPIANDLLDRYHRDLTQSTRQIEPEQVTVIESQGAYFVLGSLQETGAAIVFRLEDDSTLTLDSTQPVGIDWADELDVTHTGPGRIGPEGITAARFGDEGRTLVITANEREGSLTLLRSTCPR